MATKSELAEKFIDGLRCLDTLYEKYAQSVGLTYMSLSVLENLYQNSPCTQKQICEETHYQKQSVNVIMRAFLNQGFIEMREMDEDRRNKEIHFTETGRSYAAGIVEPLWETEEKALEKLTRQECEILVRTMDTYTNYLAENFGKEASN